MSRCFPFRPRGYTKIGTTCTTLIDESIKLQSEKDKSRPERKKEKRDKKDKKKRRKEQKTYRDSDKEPSLKLHQIHLLSIRNDESSVAGYLQKAEDDACELLERSGITQEFEEPFSSRDPVYLSDSSQHSKKRTRKRESSLSFEKDHGNGQIVTKIRLRKHEEPEKAQRREQIETAIGEAPSISSYKDWSVEGGRQSHSHPANIVSAELAILTELCDGSSSGHKPSAKKSKGIVQTYELLSGNWPQAIGMELTDLYDEDWLTGAKNQNTEFATSISSCDHDSDLIGCRNSSLWPHAQLLPEGGIYALPYTVPL